MSDDPMATLALAVFMRQALERGDVDEVAHWLDALIAVTWRRFEARSQAALLDAPRPNVIDENSDIRPLFMPIVREALVRVAAEGD